MLPPPAAGAPLAAMATLGVNAIPTAKASTALAIRRFMGFLSVE
jgi:hypothetical protein